MENKQQKKLIRRAYDATKNAIKRSSKHFKRVLLGAALGTSLGVAVTACGRTDGYENTTCYSGCPDSGALQQDASSQNDAVQFDTQPRQDSGSDAKQTDGGVDGPIPPQYNYTINNLIGDYLNRDLLDRDKGAKGYPLNTPETNPNANPFSDGSGGSIGQDKTEMNRIDGTMFAPFATATITDATAAKSYSEQQDFWVGGDSHYSDVAQDVVGNIDFAAYTLKFQGYNDFFGIPVCTTPTMMDYTGCKNTGGNLDQATETHRLTLSFLGEDWIISEMSAPAGVSLTNESQLVGGGVIRLAKEAVSGILNAGEGFQVDNLNFRYDNYEVNGATVSAIISVLDANGNLLKKDKITSGSTKEIIINGESYRFHIYEIAIGSPPNADWIDAAIFSKELKLMHGQKLDPDFDTNRYWKVNLGWKNKGASVTDTAPDHLRTVILYSDLISSLSSGGSQELLPGDYIPIVQDPVNLTLTYKGLSATPATYSTLQFELEKNSIFMVSAAYGPLGSNGQRVSCTINAPFVSVTSSASGSVFTVDGVQGVTPTGTTSASDGEFIVATNGANCGGMVGALMKGSLFMKTSPSSEYWAYLDYAPFYNTDAVRIKYPLTGDGVSDTYLGIIAYQYVKDFMPQIGDFDFTIGEETGTGVSKHSFAALQVGLKLAGSFSTFNYDAPGNGGIGYYYKMNHVTVFPSAGPVMECNTWPNSCLMEEGFITERGSVFTQITDTTVTFDIAGELVYSQFVLAKK